MGGGKKSSGQKEKDDLSNLIHAGDSLMVQSMSLHTDQQEDTTSHQYFAFAFLPCALQSRDCLLLDLTNSL